MSDPKICEAWEITDQLQRHIIEADYRFVPLDLFEQVVAELKVRDTQSREYWMLLEVSRKERKAAEREIELLRLYLKECFDRSKAPDAYMIDSKSEDTK